MRWFPNLPADVASPCLQAGGGAERGEAEASSSSEHPETQPQGDGAAQPARYVCSGGRARCRAGWCSLRVGIRVPYILKRAGKGEPKSWCCQGNSLQLPAAIPNPGLTFTPSEVAGYLGIGGDVPIQKP